jgi:hypothetical protein
MSRVLLATSLKRPTAARVATDTPGRRHHQAFGQPTASVHQVGRQGRRPPSSVMQDSATAKVSARSERAREVP